MPLGMYQASVPAFLQMLTNFSAILEKAEAFAAEGKIDPEVLLNWRLVPDMFPLKRQVQIVTDFAKGTPARLAGAEVPKYADDETCPFRKFHPAWIRIVRQNHRIIESDVCDPARARNLRHRPVQVAVPAWG